MNPLGVRTMIAMAFLGAGIPPSTCDAGAAEIKVICTPALAPAYRELIPEFERVTGHKVVIDYGTAGAIRERIQGGEAADLAISTEPVIDDLQEQGWIVPASRIEVARVGLGVQVRKAAPKPDIRSADAFRNALVTAASIGYIDPAGGGAAGVHVAAVIERLGIAAAMTPKTRLVGGSALLEAVASGEVEIGIAPISEIVSHPGVELAGPLPAELQDVTPLTASLVRNGGQLEAAGALLRFLTAPAAIDVIRAKGMEPGTRREQ